MPQVYPWDHGTVPISPGDILGESIPKKHYPIVGRSTSEVVTTVRRGYHQRANQLEVEDYVVSQIWVFPGIPWG